MFGKGLQADQNYKQQTSIKRSSTDTTNICWKSMNESKLLNEYPALIMVGYYDKLADKLKAQSITNVIFLAKDSSHKL